ncbi:Microtubule-nucleating Tub4p (gamma-tubulin) complex component [Neophaeococcomyces mojaviensis]|uniref:Microtubule-nucleating Tub4p (Gamma-tubulin) complex component n=1 Tax=Neophaeococcomyces mojaviensis TaxID=3383035 RepID=A0ACC3A4S8_9EURO|nr:Microtubule-nucleating Tub4p (gamma-tubulin) complex component [Knufia sp. JES_112]
MVDQQRLSRIDGALSQLFNSILPVDPASVDDGPALHWLNSLVENATNTVYAGLDDIPPDINSAQDLIKRKLLRENASPEKAARFSNLYSRLLAMPVLNQKWRILYLLYSLSEDKTPLNGLRSPIIELDPRAPFETKIHVQPHERPESDQSGQYNQQGPVEPRAMPESPRRNLPKALPRDHESHPQERAKSIDLTKAVVEPSPMAPPIPSELDLLRDLPFNLQGLSSSSYKFISASAVKLPTNLPVPIISLLNTLAEPCLLYKTLSNYVNSQDGGLVNQSLRAAISGELRSYLGLVATLEAEIRRASTAFEKGDDDHKGIRAAGVTLKRCVIWTRDATMGLRLMTLIIEESQSKKGGQIITLIHNFLSSHGDPFVAGFAERILAHVARPFYDMLRHWIYDGELVDPYHEFFVVESDPDAKANVDPKRVAMSVWQDKYKLDADMVPSIMSAEFAKKVFLIGKSLNFIRHNCGDADWVNQYSQNNSKSLDYANTANLSSSIDTAYQTTMSRLTYLMSNKFLLFTHLQALKRYLLLSQGDFIELLVESLAPNLDRPAHSQYRHTLTSQLEHAVRHSNAQYDDPEVLRRLDARMIELTRGDTGWDCFTLEYKISPPCDVVITQWANTQYLKIFNVMLRVKRVEYSLNMTWRKCMTGARGVLTTVDDKLAQDWKNARCLIAEMVHFVNQLQYYILFEVIEASWETLKAAMHKPDVTLDDLIEAHTKYINTIVQKGLLASSAEREDGFLVQLHNMLKCMLGFREVVESLYSFSVAEYTRRQQFTAKVERRTAAGKWGITEKDFSNISHSSTPSMARHDRNSGISISDEQDNVDSPQLLPSNAGDDATLLTSLRKRMTDLSTDFKTRINNFLYDLAHQPDVDLRFLGVVMNFNEAYKPVNPRRVHRRDRTKRDGQSADRKSHDISASSSTVTVLPLSAGNERREVAKTD